MADEFRFTIPKAQALAAGLSALGPKLALKVADKGLQAWTKPIIKEAKRTVRKRTGGLARSIVSRKGEKAAKYKALRLIGFLRPSGSHAHFIEFGTAHSAPHPFVRPAIDTKSEDGVSDMGRSIGAGIDAQAKKELGL